MEREIEQLAHQAREGDGEALERLIMEIYGDIHGLSLRMLGFASDAEDAAQEIMIKIITHLSTFRGESTFKTWSFRIAINHLLSFRKTLAEKKDIDFNLWEQLGDRTDPTFDHDSLPGTDKMLLMEEVRIGCMQGMLQCLDKRVRIAVILGGALRGDERRRSRNPGDHAGRLPEAPFTGEGAAHRLHAEELRSGQ
jgi:RNA polymerase sigma factor (sigma-70 family)